MIKIFNNTNTVQSVRIKDRSGTFYSVFIESHRSTDIEPYQVSEDLVSKLRNGTILDLSNKLAHYIETSNTINEVSSIESVVSEETTPESTEDITSDESESITDEEPSPTENESIFVCEICGNEYASNKSLAMHKSRSHK